MKDSNSGSSKKIGWDDDSVEDLISSWNGNDTSENVKNPQDLSKLFGDYLFQGFSQAGLSSEQKQDKIIELLSSQYFTSLGHAEKVKLLYGQQILENGEISPSAAHYLALHKADKVLWWLYKNNLTNFEYVACKDDELLEEITYVDADKISRRQSFLKALPVVGGYFQKPQENVIESGTTELDTFLNVLQIYKGSNYSEEEQGAKAQELASSLELSIPVIVAAKCLTDLTMDGDQFQELIKDDKLIVFQATLCSVGEKTISPKGKEKLEDDTFDGLSDNDKRALFLANVLDGYIQENFPDGKFYNEPKFYQLLSLIKDDLPKKVYESLCNYACDEIENDEFFKEIIHHAGEIDWWWKTIGANFSSHYKNNEHMVAYVVEKNLRYPAAIKDALDWDERVKLDRSELGKFIRTGDGYFMWLIRTRRGKGGTAFVCDKIIADNRSEFVKFIRVKFDEGATTLDLDKVIEDNIVNCYKTAIELKNWREALLLLESMPALASPDDVNYDKLLTDLIESYIRDNTSGDTHIPDNDEAIEVAKLLVLRGADILLEFRNRNCSFERLAEHQCYKMLNSLLEILPKLRVSDAQAFNLFYAISRAGKRSDMKKTIKLVVERGGNIYPAISYSDSDMTSEMMIDINCEYHNSTLLSFLSKSSYHFNKFYRSYEIDNYIRGVIEIMIFMIAPGSLTGTLASKIHSYNNGGSIIGDIVFKIGCGLSLVSLTTIGACIIAHKISNYKLCQKYCDKLITEKYHADRIVAERATATGAEAEASTNATATTTTTTTATATMPAM